jgi:hypothetical protein
VLLSELTSCVTNAALIVGVGIAVFTVSYVSGRSGVGVWVGTTAGTGDEVGIPPGGVGVVYCPHSEALPPQEAIKKDVATKKLISLFTSSVRCWNYTCIKVTVTFSHLEI